MFEETPNQRCEDKIICYYFFLTGVFVNRSYGSPHYLIIEFDTPVDGYDVIIKYSPYTSDGKYSERGDAVYILDNGVHHYEIASTASLWELNNSPLLPDGTTIRKKYIPKKEGDMFTEYGSYDKCPHFYFEDMDFDGEKEFVVVEWGSCSRQSENGYAVYDLVGNKAVRKKGGLFGECGQIEGDYVYDVKNRTVTIVSLDGVSFMTTTVWKSLGNGSFGLLSEKTEKQQ